MKMMNNIEEIKFLDKNISHIKHKSGLEIYVWPTKKDVFYSCIYTKYGSIDNCFKLNQNDEFTNVPDGIAHFLEHKMFENEDGDALIHFSEYGGDSNAYTSNDVTAYFVTSTFCFEENLRLLLHTISYPYFTDESIHKELGIIEEEIKAYQDRPSEALYRGFKDCLYQKNNVKIDVAGTVDSIHKITKELLYSCYDTFYNMSNMMLCIYGNVDINTILKICDEELPNQKSIDIIRKYPIEPKEINKKKIVKKLDVSRPLFIIGVKDNNVLTDSIEGLKRYAAFNILDELLFSGISEFTYKTYKEGIIRGLNSTFNYDKMCCYSYIRGESDDPDYVYSLFVEYIRKIKKEGFSKDDFNIIKRKIYSDLMRGIDKEGIVDEIFYFQKDGLNFFDYLDCFKNITIEDVYNLLLEHYNEDMYVMSVIEPIKREEKHDE